VGGDDQGPGVRRAPRERQTRRDRHGDNLRLDLPCADEQRRCSDRSDRRQASSTNPWWPHYSACHASGLEPCRAVRIWVRTHRPVESRATRPSLEGQSVPRSSLRLAAHFDTTSVIQQ
jgi:hypothetical protein